MVGTSVSCRGQGCSRRDGEMRWQWAGLQLVEVEIVINKFRGKNKDILINKLILDEIEWTFPRNEDYYIISRKVTLIAITPSPP